MGEETNMTTSTKILLVAAVILIFFLGWYGHDVYRDWKNKRLYDGLIIFSEDEEDAKSIARSMDNFGDWVCINIKGMEYETAIRICEHEVGHEIFAEMCEDNITKCFDEVDEIK